MKETGQKNNEKRLEAGIKRYVEYVTTNLIRLNSADYTYEVNYNSNAFNFYFPHEKHFKHLLTDVVEKHKLKVHGFIKHMKASKKVV